MREDTHSIRHRVEMEVPPRALYDAVQRPEALAAWWTPMVQGSPEVGATLRFRFGDGTSGPDMRITALQTDRLVQWDCIEGPWQGMHFSFAIDAHPRGSVLTFDHSGWPEASDFYRHCNTKWGFFLAVSLKDYLEKGSGRPHPEDPSI